MLQTKAIALDRLKPKQEETSNNKIYTGLIQEGVCLTSCSW